MTEPNIKKRVFTAVPYSFMNFMPEHLVYDGEMDSVIRFRGMFEMPKWDGVEDDEFTYVVEGGDERLDKIAAKFWGNERVALYWVIAARNGLDLPDVQLYKGRRLKIPSLQWIDTKLLVPSNRVK